MSTVVEQIFHFMAMKPSTAVLNKVFKRVLNLLSDVHSKLYLILAKYCKHIQYFLSSFSGE